MRIYVSVDMEGLAGVAHPHQVSVRPDVDRVDYDRSRALMAGEANAAIEAAIEAGATEVVVNDSHWQMRNLRAEDLVRQRRGSIIGDKALSMTQGDRRARGRRASTAPPSSATTPAPGIRTGVIAHTYSSATRARAARQRRAAQRGGHQRHPARPPRRARHPRRRRRRAGRRGRRAAAVGRARRREARARLQHRRLAVAGGGAARDPRPGMAAAIGRLRRDAALPARRCRCAASSTCACR